MENTCILFRLSMGHWLQIAEFHIYATRDKTCSCIIFIWTSISNCRINDLWVRSAPETTSRTRDSLLGLPLPHASQQTVLQNKWLFLTMTFSNLSSILNKWSNCPAQINRWDGRVEDGFYLRILFVFSFCVFTPFFHFSLWSRKEKERNNFFAFICFSFCGYFSFSSLYFS